MKYGYVRVSTDNQDPALQLAALKKAGCKKIFEDRGVSGVVAKRPSLTRCTETPRLVAGMLARPVSEVAVVSIR
jgi:DNA invertase Pin-like site-specific DNA recombinase